MTIFDTFYLLFKSDAKDAIKQNSDLEKQIDLLTQKGKKRSDAENAQLKEYTKRQKELNDQLKEQTKQVDQLGASFAKTIENGVGALTAFATFSGLKTGILDAQKFNRELAIQSKISHQNVTELKAYAAAYESSGGSNEGFLSLVRNITAVASQAGRPLKDIRSLFSFIRNDIKGLPTEQAQFRLQSQYGLPLESLAFFEQSESDYQKAIDQAYKLAKATEEDTRNADKFGEAWSHVSQALSTDFTHLGSDLFPSLTSGMENVANSLTDLTGKKGGVEGFFTAVAIGAPIATIALSRLAFVAAGLVTSLADLAAAPLAAGAAVTWGAGALGGWIGRKIVGNRSSSGSSSSDNPKEQIVSFWRAHGYSGGQANGWLANAQAESSLNPAASNGTHFGLYQWSAKRRAAILAGTGIDVRNASIGDQLKAAAWEASNMGITPGTLPDSSGGSAAAISNRFEVPSLTSSGLIMEAAKRAHIAESYGNVPSIPTIGGGGDKSISIKINDVTVNTQATDAAGIAQGMSSAMKNEFRNAFWNVNDGIGG